MNIYLLNSCNSENIFSNFYLNQNDFEISNIINIGKYIDDWIPPVIEYEINKPQTDIIKLWGYSSGFIINDKSMNILKKYNLNLQFLPVELFVKNNTKYYWIHILSNIEGLDTINSKTRKIYDKYIVEIYEYVFNENIVGHDVFKLILNGHVSATQIFVTDKFKKIIEENNITGLKFEKIYEFE